MRPPRAAAAVLLAACACSWPSVSSAAPKKPLKLNAAVLLGFDNNTNLDPGREGDLFAQETLSARYRKLLSKRVNLRLNYSVANVNYFSVTDQNLLSQTAGGGMDLLLAAKTILETQYNYTYAYYPRNGSVTYDDHYARAGIRFQPSRSVTLKVGGGGSAQSFDERRRRDADALLSEVTERRDGRYFLDGEAGFLVWDKSYWRLGYVRSVNDSNDQFHDYYDHSSHKFSVSGSLRWIPKVSSLVKFSYEDREYGTRPVLRDADTLQEDDIYTLSLAFFYELRKDLSLGVIHVYRQKGSNEPTQRYSGSISTLGLYYSF